MATIVSAPTGATGQAHRLNVSRLLVASAVTALAIFVLCWVGNFMQALSPTHSYISLFTARPANSPAALVEGALWSLVFGAMSGALFALIYNATASMERQ